ncbi:NACHT domain-containing protein [Actinoplanes sp. CA-015351]|uniref:NACHT domain-containing protein n=1 Tax=Actinoplanes sp. CA-015351 TaxID=3239897 RepID=UPI003D98E62D
MAAGLSYNDALKLLGGSGPLMKIADNVLGGALSVATAGGSEAAIGLFDAKTEAIRLGHLLTNKITDLVRGQSRYNRSQRLHAAHGVLVVTAFFEVLDRDSSRIDQIASVAATETPVDGWQAMLLAAPIPGPGPDVSYDELLDRLTTWYAARTSFDWLPALAVARYEEHVRRLVEEVPEFAIWMRHHHGRAASRGLEALEATLLTVTSYRDPARHRAALALAYRADLGRPILGGDTGELSMPSLGGAYLDPRFRVKPAGPGARPAQEDWWDTRVATDFAGFLATYLTTPQSVEAPLLLLGHPGAGKSSLTRILAARLPASDYLVVRVVLREVPAEAEIQDQIEIALRAAIGETVAWADVARDADAAMPVILLDGFDELLQATGIHQSDYLQRVAAFQQREAALGRPAAVMVTSRVAVADRARLPSGSLAVRLEPFDAAQLERWLATWNHANAGYWQATGRDPLTLDVVRRYPDLAEQPLLLLMLALYDADDNVIQRAGEALGTGQLYERLLHKFAEREVRRLHRNQLDSAIPGLVEDELLRLSVVAFAMFHRLRLWVTTDELDSDLAGLGLQPQRAQTQAFRGPLTAGQEMVGRFFFIQKAQAQRDDKTLQTYEFLHATFGEYLVARLVVQALTDAAARSRARTLTLGAGAEDDLLQSLLGYTPLCARATVLPFTAELLIGSAGVSSAGVREWIVERLRMAVTRPGHTPRAYQPIDKRADHWMATYSFNLTMLALACGGELRASELFLHAKDPAGWLRDQTLMWRVAVPGSMFLDAMETITVTRTWTADERRDLVLKGTASEGEVRADALWVHGLRPSSALRVSDPGTALAGSFTLDPALVSMQMSSALSDDLLRHSLEPMLKRMPDEVTGLVFHGPDDAESPAHSLLNLWLTSSLYEPSLRRAYERALTAALSRDLATDAGADGIGLVLRLLAADASRLPAADVVNLVDHIWDTKETFHARDFALAVVCLLRAHGWRSANGERLLRGLLPVVVTVGKEFSPADCLQLMDAFLWAEPATMVRPAWDAIEKRLAGPDIRSRLEADGDLAARIATARARLNDRFEGGPASV